MVPPEPLGHRATQPRYLAVVDRRRWRNEAIVATRAHFAEDKRVGTPGNDVDLQMPEAHVASDDRKTAPRQVLSNQRFGDSTELRSWVQVCV